MTKSLTDAPDVATSKRPPRCAWFGYRIGTACAASAAVATFARAQTWWHCRSGTAFADWRAAGKSPHSRARCDCRAGLCSGQSGSETELVGFVGGHAQRLAAIGQYWIFEQCIGVYFVLTAPRDDPDWRKHRRGFVWFDCRLKPCGKINWKKFWLFFFFDIWYKGCTQNRL